MNFQNNSRDIFYQTWSVTQPKAIVVIAHGLGEHSGRYEKIAKGLNERNYAVSALDHQGHGQSDGPKGHVDSFTDYHDDLKVLIDLAKNENPNIPCYLLGHSMGGLIATGYALRHTNIDALIVTAPAFGVPGMAANLQIKIGAFLGKFLPKTALSNKIDPHFVCSTKSVVEAYIADPLVHDQITLGWGRALVAEQKYIHEHLQKLSMPSLFLIPQCDKLTDHAVSEAWFELMPDGNKDIELYPNSYHEVLNEEVEGKQALERILVWLDQVNV